MFMVGCLLTVKPFNIECMSGNVIVKYVMHNFILHYGILTFLMLMVG